MPGIWLSLEFFGVVVLEEVEGGFLGCVAVASGWLFLQDRSLVQSEDEGCFEP